MVAYKIPPNIIVNEVDMRRVAIVGGGHTDFVFNSPKTGIELFAEAAMEAIYESNLKPKNIQAIYCGNGLGDFKRGTD